MRSLSRPGLVAFLGAFAPVAWTWLVAVALVYAVQLGAGLGTPSMGLALSSAALPALAVAATPTSLRRWAMVGAAGVLGLLALGDAAYHGFFGDYIPLSMAGAAGQLWEVKAYGGGLLTPGSALPTLALLATGAVAMLVRAPDPRSHGRWHRALPLVVSFLALCPAIGWAWMISPATGDNLTGGFLYAHLLDVRVRVGRLAEAPGPGPDEWRRLLELTERKDDARSADAWYGRAAGSSVILIQVEALNDWVLDADVGGQPVMPFVRSLAGRGVRFTRVYDDVHLGRSSDADYLVMASQHPLDRGAISMVRPDLDMFALPDVVGALGYATLSAHAHNPQFWNARSRHRAYGFQTSLFDDDLGTAESVGFGLTDRAFFERVAPAVEALPRPFLGWFITMTMHGPHGDVPASFRTLPLGSLTDTPIGSYLLKARHTDDAIREFVADLDHMGVLAHATLVVYGDHTESFGFDPQDVRRLAHVPPGPDDLQRLELDRIGLVVVPPGDAGPDAGVRVATAGTLLDVAPTVLHLLGAAAPRSFLGRSLLPESAGFAAQVTGEAVGEGVMWTGAGCYDSGSRSALPAPACDALRARAREQLQGSWLITLYGLSATLDHAPPAAAGAHFPGEPQ